MSLPRAARTSASAFTFFSATLVNCVDVAAVQPRRAAAAGAVGERALDAVAFVDLHEIVADRGLLVLDEARGNTATVPCRLAMRTRDDA